VAVTVTEDDAPVGVDLLFGATDAESDPLGVVDATVVASDGRDLTGIASIAGDTLQVIPEGFNDLASGAGVTLLVNYGISDGTGVTPTAATVTVLGVNDAPDAANDVYQMKAGTTLTVEAALGILANDSDPDGDSLRLLASDGVENGTLLLAPDGSFTYTPDPGFVGTETISYTISDGTETATASVTITVEDAAVPNRVPEVSPIAAAFGEDQTGRVVDLLDPAFVSDPDGDDLAVANVTARAVGGRSVATTTDPATGILTLADGQFDDLAEGELLEIAVAYQVTDGSASVGNTATVTITGANDAPVPGSIGVAASEDDAPFALNLLGGATDAEDDPLAVIDVQATASDGRDLSGIVGTGGTLASVDPRGFGDLNAGESVIVTVDYLIGDGLDATPAQATITVTGLNDAPEIDPAAFAVDENQTVVGQMTASDVDDTDLGFAIVGGDDAGLFEITADGQLSFRAAPDFEAPQDQGGVPGDNVYEVEVAVSDPSGASSAATRVAVTVGDVEEDDPGLNVILGTAGRDILVGTAEADQFVFNGGFADVGRGNGGDDVFDFTENVGNGLRDVTRIMDWSEGDMILGFDLDDVIMETVRSSGSFVRFAYGPDQDVVTVTGDVSGGLASLFDISVA
jgi:VCBS repeat-containing protein